MKNYKLLFWVLLLFISTKGYSQLNVSSLDFNINPAILNPSEGSTTQTKASLGARLEGFSNKNYFSHVNYPVSEKLTINGGYFGLYTDKSNQDFLYLNSNYTFSFANDIKFSVGAKGSLTKIKDLKESFNFGLGIRMYTEKMSFGFSFPLILRQNYLVTLGGFSEIDNSSTWGIASFKTRLIKTDKYSLHANFDFNFSDGEYETIMQAYHSVGNLGFEYKRKNKYNLLAYCKFNDKFGIAFDKNFAENMKIGVGYSHTLLNISELKSNHNISLYLKYKILKQ